MKYLLLSTLALASLHAGEHTLKESLFEKTLSLDATFIPSEATVLKIDPQQWSSYVILELTDHGSSVKKGDVLLSCDPEDFQKHLAETKKGVAGRKIALARAERELADLEISTPHELESQRLKVERAQESLDYFKKTGRALEVETTKERLESSKRSLSYYEEELKQLLKMYGEDQVTEETEEIILKRQRTAVKSAKFALKKNQLSTAWALEKTIPQKALDLERKFEASSRAFETAKLNLPRVLEEKRLSVAKAK
ncbi:HlyD family secretion protein, partial [Akkermansiaceae bacterium]|nr:HlyD family secretion protein [Akkermansiaceae bacterium]